MRNRKRKSKDCVENKVQKGRIIGDYNVNSVISLSKDMDDASYNYLHQYNLKLASDSLDMIWNYTQSGKNTELTANPSTHML